MKSIASSPLLHFLLLGAGLFFFYELVKPTEKTEDAIVVDDEVVTRTIVLFQKEWGREPNAEELSGLLENQIRMEVFYRQALKMNLDHNDELIKRRMQQKLSFITTDLTNLQEPEEDSLKAFYARNRSQYLQPGKVSFSHIYFSPDKRKQPLKDAIAWKQKLLAGTAAYTDTKGGDAFTYATRADGISMKELTDIMGREFADTLTHLETGSWQGPVLSGFGVHLVFVREVASAVDPAWETIKEDVLRDYQYAASAQLNEKIYRDFRKQYDVRLMITDSSLRKWPLQKMLNLDDAH